MMRQMKVFSQALAAHRIRFARDGYCCIEQAVSGAFLDFVRIQAQQRSHESSPYDLPGKKRQLVFDLADLDFEAMIRAPLAGLIGVDPGQLTLSERHLNIYLPSAADAPVPHKDRAASEVAVGIPIALNPASYLVLYPQISREPNPYDSAAEWRRNLAPAERPEVCLRDAEPVELRSRPGDLVAFRGSSMLHERMYAAGSTILYFKFNTQGLDPLGEDPRKGR